MDPFLGRDLTLLQEGVRKECWMLTPWPQEGTEAAVGLWPQGQAALDCGQGQEDVGAALSSLLT